MLKSNKNNARNKISQCVEFRSKNETAIRGNIDGEKTWNNLDQNVLRKIFLAGGFTTAMPSSCVCKYWREIGKPIARELNPVKMRIKRQLDLARKAANSYYSYDSSSESDKEEADGEALDEAKLKEKEVQSARKFVIDKEEEITQKRLDNALLLQEGEAQRKCKFRQKRRRYGGHYNLFNIRNSVERLLLPPRDSDGGKMSTKKVLDENWGLWAFAARLFHREERTQMNKLLRVYVSRQMVYRRRALAVGFEELGIPAKFLNSAKYRKVREFIEYGEGHVLGARYKKRTVRVQKVLESMFNVYNQGQGEARMAESVLRFNEVKASVLRELKSFEDDKALGDRAFKMHFAPKDEKKKTAKAATKVAKTTKKEPQMAKTKAKKRKSIKDEEKEADKEFQVNNLSNKLSRSTAKKMKIKKEEEVVLEEDSAKTKIFGKTKRLPKSFVKKEDKTLNSEKTLPKKPVVVPAPEAAKPTLTLLPETQRRSSRARKPSTKAAASAVKAATEMKKATGKGTKKRCNVM